MSTVVQVVVTVCFVRNVVVVNTHATIEVPLFGFWLSGWRRSLTQIVEMRFLFYIIIAVYRSHEAVHPVAVLFVARTVFGR